MKEFLKTILEKMNKPNNESLKFSMRNVHAKGVFSLVIDGTEFGKLTRIFIAHKKLKPFDVQYHTHRYPVTITTLKGNITHHTAETNSDSNALYSGGLIMSLFNYKSVLNGGNGLNYVKEVEVKAKECRLPVGSKLHLGTFDFHTMSCDKGSIWIVEERGFEKDSSEVLGVPFTVDNLYNEPAMFQITDNCQKVDRVIKELILQYELVDF